MTRRNADNLLVFRTGGQNVIKEEVEGKEEDEVVVSSLALTWLKQQQGLEFRAYQLSSGHHWLRYLSNKNRHLFPTS